VEQDSHSDSSIYAGSNFDNRSGATAEEARSHGQALSLVPNLPPLAVLMLRAED
jgi:1,4-alpha-glucan branching enzyme